MQSDLERVLFAEATILHRLDEIGGGDFCRLQSRELTVIAVLNGSLIFMADLLRRIPLPLKLDCLSVASYHGEIETTGEIVFRQIALPDIAGRHILILDDILDSGTTLAAIQQKLETAQPLSVKICVLLKKIETHACDRSRRIMSASRNRGRIRGGLRTRLYGAVSEFAMYRRPPKRADRDNDSIISETDDAGPRAILFQFEGARGRIDAFD